MARKILFTSLFSILLFVGLPTVLAQTNPPGPNCTPPQLPCCPTPGACGPSCPDCTPVPFDNELILLLSAGLIFGTYCLKKQK